jgi:tetratricopeptide (TPR) repeat protein
MSLLLDALKRAEQEKLARGSDAPKPARAPESHGFDTESPRLAPISAPVLELQPVESASAGAAQPGASADAKAVQNAFAAKAAASPAANRGRAMLWLGLAGIVVVVAAAGGYIWYTIQQLTPPPFAARARPRPPAALTPPAATAEPSSAARMEQLVAMANAKSGTPAPAPLPAEASAPAVAAPAPTATVTPVPAARAATPPTSAQKTLDGLLREGERQPAEEPFSMQRSQEPARVPSQVGAGYEALRLGDFERARRDYTAAVEAQPDNLDAQLGLATVEARAGHRALAASIYRKALEIDPKDPTALAGLAALGDTNGVEAELRAQPQGAGNAPMHFSRGNLFAGQGRWSEAQAEFFDAYRLDPANADILFNLAVSLDHLGQSRLAAGYYQGALEAAGRQAAQFDPAAASRRLAELRAQSRP